MEKKIIKPHWLKKKIYYSEKNQELRNLIKNHRVHTVCEEARCPNQSDCYHDKTATFLIMGTICTRSCLFCSVESASALQLSYMPPLDKEEPYRIAKLIKQMSLNYAVITSVDRDDLFDYGAGHFAKTIETIKKNDDQIKIEVLTPDLNFKKEWIARIVDEKPNVYNHNIETVESISKKIRKQSSYSGSLKVLETVKEIDPKMITKSGLMLGFGEKEKEIIQVIKDLKDVGCDILTIGQYLQPTKRNIPVKEYITDDCFNEYKQEALKLGIKVVHSGPFIRSSFKAAQSYYRLIN